MRTTTLALSLAVLAGSAIPLATPAFAQAERAAANSAPVQPLPVKRITLYRSGVGSFERRGLVDGDATVQLRFNTDQINDILKSMVVLDLSKSGRIDGISYGSKDPLTRRLGSFAVDISGEPSMATLLAQLRGTEAVVSLAEGAVTGVILGIEEREEALGNAQQLAKATYLNLVTPEGIRSIKLSLASAVHLKDKSLNEELARALAAVAEYRADRTKTVDVKLRGEGAREVVIGYLHESPVWKTSYRLVLPDQKDTKQGSNKDSRFTIQGWAIVENTTDDDWEDVTLSLVAGRPVSFRMDLYEPLYVHRPEVPVPTVPGVTPRTYEGGMAAEGEKPGEEGGRFGRVEAASDPRGRAPGAPTATGAPAAAGLRAKGTAGMSAEDMAGYAAQAQAQAVEAGEVFQFEIDHPVTVERQRSAMIPIIASGIDGRRVSIFNASDRTEHPMRGLELTNSTGLQLMPGPISVYDGGAYAGDAQVGHIPAGDKRLLAYAVDLEVTHTDDQKSASRVRKVRVTRGQLVVSTQGEYSVTHTFANKDLQRARTIIVEQPRLPDWALKTPEKPLELTDSLYRFEVEVAPGKSASITISQERVDSSLVAMNSINMETLLAYSRQGDVPKAVMDAFQEASRRQGLVRESEQRISSLESELKGIDTDQGRIRQNMNSIDRASELYKKYMQKLTEQEARVEEIGQALNAERAKLATLRSELDTWLNGLTIE